ncbi:recombinase family protein [Pelosinus sp. UFO1]|uniref:recombinase family protein n=1 Tax=Pelosinus sp. UFO1 TaxID=484770 RepID=UPI0004D100F6|nr:recombinase family protein [Pelosinus sp. UFO1]AIF51856.1 Resolvase domain-containing protein [Pelosinus sp. UFO1]
MLNIAVYCRVSSEDQQERGTIENQIEFATKYCDLHQLNIVKWYKDDGISGTLPFESRPEASIMLQDAQEKKFDTLLFYRLDRFGRSARTILNGVHTLEQYGIKIKSMTEPFDTGDPSGRFLLTILAGVADLERSNILDRLWHGTNRAARNGKWLGGICPYGYRVDDEGFLTVSDTPLPGFDMSEADVVQMIYRLTTEQHMSTIKIADYLNALGIPPKYAIEGRKIAKGKRKENTSGHWLPGRVRNMIVQETYKGIHFFGKRSKKVREVIKREVPAIVDEDSWDKAQLVLKDNQLEAVRFTKYSYLLKSLVKCSLCGLNFSGTGYSGVNGQRTAYYVCNGKTSYRGKYMGKCVAKNVAANWLDEKVWNDCVNFINNPGQLLTDLSPDEQELLLITSSLSQKDTEKQSILDLYRKQLITSKDVEDQLSKIAIERSALEYRQKELKNALLTTNDEDYRKKDALMLLGDLKEKLTGQITYETKRNIIKQLVREVVVCTTHSDNRDAPEVKVHIKFVFPQIVPCTDKDSLP